MERIIECVCGANETLPDDEQRWHARQFQHVFNVDNEHLNNEAVYYCTHCNRYVISNCVPDEKER